MMKLEELFDLGFALVRREVKVRVSLIKELEGNMKGFKKWEEKLFK